MKSALLVIDVQQALCSGEEAAYDIDNIIGRINNLSHQARAAKHPVIMVQHEEHEGSLRFDSAGWQLAAELDVSPEDLRIRKTTPNAFHETGLHGLLQQHDVTQLVICGLQTDFCVDTTVRQALALGYEVILVADGHSTVDNGVLTAAQIIAHHNRTLGNMTSFGVRALTLPAKDVGLISTD